SRDCSERSPALDVRHLSPLLPKSPAGTRGYGSNGGGCSHGAAASAGQPVTRANRSVGRGGSVGRAGDAGVDGIQRSGEAAAVGLVHPFAIELFVEPARCFVIGDELLNGGVGF